MPRAKIKKVEETPEVEVIESEVVEIDEIESDIACQHSNQLEKGDGVVVCNDCKVQLRP